MERNKLNKKCKNCRNNFIMKSNKQQYCSQQCWTKSKEHKINVSKQRLGKPDYKLRKTLRLKYNNGYILVY